MSGKQDTSLMNGEERGWVRHFWTQWGFLEGLDRKPGPDESQGGTHTCHTFWDLYASLACVQANAWAPGLQGHQGCHAPGGLAHAQAPSCMSATADGICTSTRSCPTLVLDSGFQEGGGKDHEKKPNGGWRGGRANNMLTSTPCPHWD